MIRRCGFRSVKTYSLTEMGLAFLTQSSSLYQTSPSPVCTTDSKASSTIHDDIPTSKTSTRDDIPATATTATCCHRTSIKSTNGYDTTTTTANIHCFDWRGAVTALRQRVIADMKQEEEDVKEREDGKENVDDQEREALFSSSPSPLLRSSFTMNIKRNM